MNENAIGQVQSVDTGNATIHINNEQVLNDIQVNQIVKICSTKVGETIIALVSKIVRRAIAEKVDSASEPDVVIENVLKVNLVGTLLDRNGTERNVFKRTINTIPCVNADCFLLKGEDLSAFMGIISSKNKNPLELGQYTIADEAKANIDGNKFFQRHAVIVGGTGSGKSWTVAKILEAASKLISVNSVLFDLHGEYTPLQELPHSTLLKIAGPASSPNQPNVLFLPYWLLSYDEMTSLLLDRSDMNAPNQARILFDLILKYKREKLSQEGQNDIIENLTVESPVPFDITKLVSDMKTEDERMVPGAKASTEKAGPLNGKLTRFIQRLRSKLDDKRLNFMFNSDDILLKYDWLNHFAKQLFDFGESKKGLKIIDFSEVPSDILPLITGLVARIIFSLQQWMEESKRHPISIFADEAHLYIPSNIQDSLEEMGLKNFERIAKEGRKYGISLVVISQRPADVSKTVLSQCGNFIAMRLTNPDDQNVIKRLFPDNLGDFSELLPILDVGESLMVGDACLLPSRIQITPPTIRPNSATIDFWNEWSKVKNERGIDEAVEALRKQHK